MYRVKIILATNAAESSITLPDVDMVICLGTHKALRYESTSHRVQLVNTWVSKASATQRAGMYICINLMSTMAMSTCLH